MLKQPVPSLTRWIGGAAVVGALAFGVGFAAWSAQPARDSAMTQASEQLIGVRMRFEVDGKAVSTSEVITRSGQPFSVSDGRFLLGMVATTREDDSIGLAGDPSWNGHRMGEIKVALTDGKPETFRFSSWQVEGERRPELALIVDASTAPTRVVLPVPPPPPVPPAPPAPSAVPAIPPVAPAPPAPPALPAPAYPKEALAQHVNGKVVLLIDIDAQGNPTNVVVDKSEPAGVFDQASIDAARKWKFQPAVKDGRPVAGRISVPVQFESRGNPDPAGAKDSSPAPSAPDARG